MSWALTLVPVPVSDVDRARTFYTEQVGFHLDHDTQLDGTMRLVQLTPPGSGCSIAIGTDLVDSEPGSLTGLLLVVPDLARGPGRAGGPGASRSARSSGSARRTGRPSCASATRTATAGRSRRSAGWRERGEVEQ